MVVTASRTAAYEETAVLRDDFEPCPALPGAFYGVEAVFSDAEEAPDVEGLDIDDPHELGLLGEELAAFYMEENGYTVCERNYRTPHGEADMVCRRGSETVLVEVKTRRGGDSFPEEAVDARKMRRYRGITLDYLAEGCQTEFVRFDVIALNVVGPHHARLRHYVGVCSWEG